MLQQIFFSCRSLGESISSTNAQAIDSDKMGELLKKVVLEDEDYLGILDGDENVLQITIDPQGGYRVELADFDARRGLVRQMSVEQTHSFLCALPASFKKLDLTDFTTENWPEH